MLFGLYFFDRLIGSGEYSLVQGGIQHFPTLSAAGQRVKYVKLHIKSNHGNDKFTCLYRFGVHSDHE